MRRLEEFSIYNIFSTDKSSFVKPVTSNMVAKEAIVSSHRGMKIHADKYKHTFTVNRVSGLASCLVPRQPPRTPQQITKRLKAWGT